MCFCEVCHLDRFIFSSITIRATDLSQKSNYCSGSNFFSNRSFSNRSMYRNVVEKIISSVAMSRASQWRTGEDPP